MFNFLMFRSVDASDYQALINNMQLQLSNPNLDNNNKRVYHIFYLHNIVLY